MFGFDLKRNKRLEEEKEGKEGFLRPVAELQIAD